ncbi:uncharacterized protein LOC114292697 isoform X2 [Camellia sinensis]|uniref:uncharacterized protein LOC114292697 isoform X2 n=1 Tax=Camellia sinensis TaxID=4442 RepID=UPI00103599EE|nr:uncharacterized protein LOC114292697 isoform X2 [Camellia sinensis]
MAFKFLLLSFFFFSHYLNHFPPFFFSSFSCHLSRKQSFASLSSMNFQSFASLSSLNMQSRCIWRNPLTTQLGQWGCCHFVYLLWYSIVLLTLARQAKTRRLNSWQHGKLSCQFWVASCCGGLKSNSFLFSFKLLCNVALNEDHPLS